MMSVKNNPARIAIIDMGTNTFHLLIAAGNEGGFTILHREHLAVKIGKDGINQGYITESAMSRTLQAMQHFHETIRSHEVSKVHAIGTSALRSAKNGAALAQEIEKRTGIKIAFIDGNQEAELIYFGVKSALNLGRDKNLILDIGGGSVEFIIGNEDQIFWKQSFEIGVQRLQERFHKHEPILEQETEALNQFLNETLTPLFEVLDLLNPHTLVGSSGTFDTLSDIYCHRHHIPTNESETETPLTIEGFFEIYKLIIAKNNEERSVIPGMLEMRVDSIVVACCLINFLLHRHSFRNIRVSTYSLKEGMLAWLQMKGEEAFKTIQPVT